jgi:transmembrane sensor
VPLGRKIGIEPLGDLRWARVERAILSARPEGEGGEEHGEANADARPPVRLRGATALVLAGALAAAFGAVTWRALGQSDPSMALTRIATAAIGSRIELGESTVEVGPQSSVRVTGDDSHGISVLVDTGRVECDVAPRRGRPPFLVEAGAVEVRVVGTHFVVTRSGDDVTVAVQRGRVEVLSGHEHTYVDAGARWPASAANSNPAPSAAVAPTPASVPAAPVPTADSPPRASAPEPRWAALSPVRLTPRDEYESASKLEARQPDAAVAAYAELAAQGGAWGMNALFAEGRLEADRGRRGDAERLLQEYLARYPFGPNAEDARRLLERMR